MHIFVFRNELNNVNNFTKLKCLKLLQQMVENISDHWHVQMLATPEGLECIEGAKWMKQTKIHRFYMIFQKT